MLIHFILTGGTIDSYYDGTKDTAVPQQHSAIPRFVQGLNLLHTYKFTEVCMKDSRDLTPKDQAKIVRVIKNSTAKKIIVTHGTYTMPDSARYIKHKLGKTNKTVILTGSMIPLDGFNFSDAGFNLGFAIANLVVQKPDIYIAMNGRILEADNATKIISEGRFSNLT